jgi:hypothetical protein
MAQTKALMSVTVWMGTTFSVGRVPDRNLKVSARWKAGGKGNYLPAKPVEKIGILLAFEDANRSDVWVESSRL